MTKHVADKPRDRAEGSRAAPYVKIERETRPSPATKALQRRPQGESAARLREYARIEKGAQA